MALDSTWCPDPGSESTGDVAIVVGLAEQDQIGRIGLGQIGQSPSHRRPNQIVGRVDLHH